MLSKRVEKMNDAITTLKQLKDHVDHMVVEREWQEFHTPKNLAMNIVAEASELMEHFLWCSTEQSPVVMAELRKEIEQELADVIIAAVAFANAAHIDIAHAFERKLQEVKDKYPVDSARGRADKYTAYATLKKKARSD